ncbi:MAG: hypothetical protein PVH11_05035, partial [Anaerolineae bacterium]
MNHALRGPVAAPVHGDIPRGDLRSGTGPAPRDRGPNRYAPEPPEFGALRAWYGRSKGPTCHCEPQRGAA